MESEDTLWLKDAWVGRLKNPALFERLEDEFRWGLGLEAIPRYLGDDKVLFLGLTDDDADNLINGGTTGGSSVLSSISRWNPRLRVGCRLTWIQCWGIPIQAWNQNFISQIVADVGELVDLDDSVEEKRRLDRARVLVKTTRRPLIQHTVEVQIGEEQFMVQIAEECCGGCQDRCRRGRNARGSSEELNSDDSFLDSSSFTNWGIGDNDSFVPETESCSGRPSTMAVDGADHNGEQQPQHLPVSDLHIAHHGIVAETEVGPEVRQSLPLPTGQVFTGYPLDNVCRAVGGDQRTITHGPNLNFLQVPDTNDTHDIEKKGAMQQVTLLNRGDAFQSYHHFGNEEHGESSGLEMNQKLDIEVGDDVEKVHDMTMTRGIGKHKEVEALYAGEETRATLNHQNSSFTPKDKRSNLGLNPKAGGVQIFARYIPGIEGARRNHLWALSHRAQVMKQRKDSHNLQTLSSCHFKGSQSMTTLKFHSSHSLLMESKRQLLTLRKQVIRMLFRCGAWPSNWASREREARRLLFKSLNIWRRETGQKLLAGRQQLTLMKIISYNVRGLGRGVKWGAIRRLVKLEGVDMLCLQETKKEVVDKALCQALWGHAEVNWEFLPAISSAGGILCLWGENSFRLQRKISGPGFILLTGEWVQEAQLVTIVTIYSPCDINRKRILWDSVKQLRQALVGGLWCILGDFNSIRRPGERFTSGHSLAEDNSSREFNEWIDDLEVLEVPWLGRNFTWYRPNGASRSRLDRFLILMNGLKNGLTAFKLLSQGTFRINAQLSFVLMRLIGAPNLSG